MVNQTLTRRWTPLRPHPVQLALITDKVRFKVVPAGRRSGKTERAKRYLVRIALGPQIFDDARYFFAAPTREQAKRIYWKDVKKLIPQEFIKTVSNPGANVVRKAISETELSIELINGATIFILGLDKPERAEGQPWDGGVVDEVADTKKSAWKENILPLFADRKGWCWFIGVPEGRNHYYDMSLIAQDVSEEDWAFYTWESADILPPEEIAFYKRTLDERTFNQEFRAKFENYAGLAYYPFDPKIHIQALKYDGRARLVFCFDFNVSPGVAIVCQETKLPNGEMGTACIGEVHIPQNSNTPAVCRKLIQDWGHHTGMVECYGDASGGARGTSQVSGSDWDLIKQELRIAFPNIRFSVPRANPPQKARVNAMNARLRASDGTVRIMIDPICKNLIDDFAHVELLEGGSGEINKDNDEYTHMTDALGYYISKEFPVNTHDLPGNIRVLGRG